MSLKKIFTSLGRTFLPSNFEHINKARFASTYKAAVLEKLNGPLKIETVKRKKLKSGEVRIKVHACSVNSSDYLLTQGTNPGNFSVPIVPGYEVSGEVLETSECDEIAKGDRVVALSKSSLGGFAEECTVHEKDVWLVPGGLDYTEAATIPDSFGRAMLGLVTKGKLKEKETVIVTLAATYGFAALDLAANVFKAKVIAVCLSENDTALLRERGAWMASSYNDSDIRGKVKELTKSKGVDLVYDTLAGDVLLTCMKCIRHEGRILVAGYTQSDLPLVRMSDFLFLPSFSITGVSLTTYRKHDFGKYRQAVSDALEMKEQGLISPVINARFPFEDASKAIKMIKEKLPLGKVVLEMNSTKK